MTKDQLNEKISSSLCEEFQSVWLIDVNTLEMTPYSVDMEESIPNSVETVTAFNNYETARLWYVEHCVAKQDQHRLEQQSEVANIMSKISDGKSYYIEYSRLSGEKINYNQLVYSKIEDDNGQMIYFILGFRDIDVRKKAERDDLTGLYTRQVFFQKAEKLLQDNPDAVYDLMISDIVDFKKINELYGAPVGDEILRWSGAFLAASISDEILVGRYGGDQFVVMCRHEVMEVFISEEAHATFLEALNDSGLPQIIIKFGVYYSVKRNKTIISTCDKAHIALNSIKYMYGKYKAAYDENMKKEIESRRKIENTMRQALAEEQFKVYYQPKHDAKTGKMVGAEALIRWIHPENGFMSPGDFIPLFEKNGFIVETDYYVWKRTCANLRRWQDKGLQIVPLSVNFSRLAFEQPELLMNLQKAVTENRIQPSMLHLEITETMVTDDLEALTNKLSAIRAIGYHVDLDDFGSGYSSINILSTLPLDVIKLDMSFMKQFGDPRRAKVLAACINLAKELGYTTISEGVEQKEQRDMLEILGVDSIQGYYYSKPLPEDEFEEYMAKYV